MNPKQVIFLLLSVGILMLPTPSLGLSDDAQQPIQVEADTAEFDDNTGISVYRGKVRVTQGSMVLRGDHVTVTAPDRRLKKITSKGKPSTFHQVTDEGENIDAEAEHMEYNTTANKIILLKKATLHQGKNSFSSERIEYNLITKIVDAGDPKSGDRVKMTIMPNTIDTTP